MASVLDVGRECGKASSAALVFGPCDSCPSTFDLCLVKHPLEWFGVDLPVSFHLLGWHRLALLDHARMLAFMAKNPLIPQMWIICG
jgi:hypothetical protein